MSDKNLLFVFMDESGKKESDPFFTCGFLEIYDNQLFYSKLQRVYDQIKNLSIRNRQKRAKKLFEEKNIKELFNLAKSFNEFELKYYQISKENFNYYCDLIKILFRKIDFRFTAIIFDRTDSLYKKDSLDENPLYLKAFKLYTSYCIKTKNYIFIHDNFESDFIWNVKSGNLPLSIVPLDSKACLQLQICDIFSGLITQALKNRKKNLINNKDKIREPVLKTLEEEINHQIDYHFTLNRPKYFNIWKVDWSKAKKF